MILFRTFYDQLAFTVNVWIKGFFFFDIFRFVLFVLIVCSCHHIDLVTSDLISLVCSIGLLYLILTLCRKDKKKNNKKNCEKNHFYPNF